MQALHLPWLEMGILLPLIGAILAGTSRTGTVARRWALGFSSLTLLSEIGAWRDFWAVEGSRYIEAHDGMAIFGANLFVIDELSAILLPLCGLLYFLTILGTVRSKFHEFSFGRFLLAESILLATLSCKQPWAVVVFMLLGILPPYLELVLHRKPTRVYLVHMGLFAGLLVVGQALMPSDPRSSWLTIPAVLLLTAATLLRNGICPVHIWITDLFEHATFGTALATVTPMIGAYGVARLVLPFAPGWVLQAISIASLLTALYAACMTTVQREARRFCCYLFLSQSSLVLVGIETAMPIGLTGALSLWISVGLSVTGFGLTLRLIESRVGRISLVDFQGLQRQVPMLSAMFLVTALACIGFPGTIGFIGVELLLEGATQALPIVGTLVVAVMALNGLSMIHAYFRVFSGKQREGTIDLAINRLEKISVLALIFLVIGGGLYPQPGVTSIYHAAVGLANDRAQHGFPAPAPAKPHAGDSHTP